MLWLLPYLVRHFQLPFSAECANQAGQNGLYEVDFRTSNTTLWVLPYSIGYSQIPLGVECFNQAGKNILSMTDLIRHQPLVQI